MTIRMPKKNYDLRKAVSYMRRIHEVEAARYISNPKEFPFYEDEWFTFIKKRTENIVSLGGDFSSYDYVQEFQTSWVQRLPELMKFIWRKKERILNRLAKHRNYRSVKNLVKDVSRQVFKSSLQNLSSSSSTSSSSSSSSSSTPSKDSCSSLEREIQRKLQQFKRENCDDSTDSLLSSSFKCASPSFYNVTRSELPQLDLLASESKCDLKVNDISLTSCTSLHNNREIGSYSGVTKVSESSIHETLKTKEHSWLDSSSVSHSPNRSSPNRRNSVNLSEISLEKYTSKGSGRKWKEKKRSSNRHSTSSYNSQGKSPKNCSRYESSRCRSRSCSRSVKSNHKYSERKFVNSRSRTRSRHKSGDAIPRKRRNPRSRSSSRMKFRRSSIHSRSKSPSKFKEKSRSRSGESRSKSRSKFKEESRSRCRSRSCSRSVSNHKYSEKEFVHSRSRTRSRHKNGDSISRKRRNPRSRSSSRKKSRRSSIHSRSKSPSKFKEKSRSKSGEARSKSRFKFKEESCSKSRESNSNLRISRSRKSHSRSREFRSRSDSKSEHKSQYLPEELLTASFLRNRENETKWWPLELYGVSDPSSLPPGSKDIDSIKIERKNQTPNESSDTDCEWGRAAEEYLESMRKISLPSSSEENTSQLRIPLDEVCAAIVLSPTKKDKIDSSSKKKDGEILNCLGELLRLVEPLKKEFAIYHHILGSVLATFITAKESLVSLLTPDMLLGLRMIQDKLRVDCFLLNSDDEKNKNKMKVITKINELLDHFPLPTAKLGCPSVMYGLNVGEMAKYIQNKSEAEAKIFLHVVMLYEGLQKVTSSQVDELYITILKFLVINFSEET